MKRTRQVIHFVKHKKTGAEVPVIIKKINKDSNIIEDYAEHVENRKGFTLKMLIDRWNIPREEVVELLQSYNIPAHLRYSDAKNIKDNGKLIDAAIFFEEYVYALEKKANLPHKKIKSFLTEHLKEDVTDNLTENTMEH